MNISQNGDTPLHCAAENGRTVTIERLLDHHADIDARNEVSCYQMQHNKWLKQYIVYTVQ